VKTHQVLVGRLYFFVGGAGLKTQYAVASGPPRGRGIVLNSHAVLAGVGGERECSENKTMNGKQKELR
jgi:hypothetical protein